MAALAGRIITALLFRTPCEGRFYHSVTSPSALAAISHAPNTPRRFYARNTTIHDLRLSTLPIQYHHRAGVIIDLWTRTRAGYPDSPVFTFCPASFKRALLYFFAVYPIFRASAGPRNTQGFLYGRFLGGRNSCIIQDGHSLTALGQVDCLSFYPLCFPT